uniref:Uncharacterized protein n=1 Tax=Sexangularia sp. CB-2014 TaxID=1486929 RepID=A0A7S1VHR9_9EUKA|eukprot:CAMPEP_0170742742 /NCGR_PEP_ID=MMETSP0437-20130122/6902_1 /TAXON_ID=0 /ORGANISM="Sexangularia sp." /LENGTH=512 /DNA_ID=CAMNT_0011081375 /DNA_START=46 /DNA_END=1584 /DNA_ORIENTATION=-
MYPSPPSFSPGALIELPNQTRALISTLKHATGLCSGALGVGRFRAWLFPIQIGSIVTSKGRVGRITELYLEGEQQRRATPSEMTKGKTSRRGRAGKAGRPGQHSDVIVVGVDCPLPGGALHGPVAVPLVGVEWCEEEGGAVLAVGDVSVVPNLCCLPGPTFILVCPPDEDTSPPVPSTRTSPAPSAQRAPGGSTSTVCLTSTPLALPLCTTLLAGQPVPPSFTLTMIHSPITATMIVTPLCGTLPPLEYTWRHGEATPTQLPATVGPTVGTLVRYQGRRAFVSETRPPSSLLLTLPGGQTAVCPVGHAHLVLAPGDVVRRDCEAERDLCERGDSRSPLTTPPASPSSPCSPLLSVSPGGNRARRRRARGPRLGRVSEVQAARVKVQWTTTHWTWEEPTRLLSASGDRLYPSHGEDDPATPTRSAFLEAVRRNPLLVESSSGECLDEWYESLITWSAGPREVASSEEEQSDPVRRVVTPPLPWSSADLDEQGGDSPIDVHLRLLAQLQSSVAT